MCGIVGIHSHQRVAEKLYQSLIHLQHRGQDSAGILTSHQQFDMTRGLGLVREIFTDSNLAILNGNIGIAHVRYPTSGGYSLPNVQPIFINNPLRIALAHNGNLVNDRELARELAQEKKPVNSFLTDSEVLLHLLNECINKLSPVIGDASSYFSMLCDAVQTIFNRVQGSYSVVSVIQGKGLLAFRDPHGIRPLLLGEKILSSGEKEYIIASETTMFYSLGFQLVGDIHAGEIVFINQDNQLFRYRISHKQFSPCIFEYVYFARPDSIINGVNVHNARSRMGELLAKRWKAIYPHLIPDIVIPTPFTSNTATLAFAHELKIRYCEGLYKNPFIGRTFIMPDTEDRQRQIGFKLTPQQAAIEGKKVLIVDDSIVRGTTSQEIVKMVREFNAKEVYFVSSCPPIINPCFYGIDIPASDKLIAANKSLEEIRRHLNVDILLYQEINDLCKAVAGEEELVKTPCLACMNGHYITGDINQKKIQQLGEKRQQNREKLCEF
ncbi:amidophosphoribosyltransferase [Legionella sp.]|uniref:amidophosphoribosyltransferase n=1 Tax=Legionella sp. TaxID=459 RepID=UPI003C94F3BE